MKKKQEKHLTDDEAMVLGHFIFVNKSKRLAKFFFIAVVPFSFADAFLSQMASQPAAPVVTETKAEVPLSPYVAAPAIPKTRFFTSDHIDGVVSTGAPSPFVKIVTGNVTIVNKSNGLKSIESLHAANLGRDVIPSVHSNKRAIAIQSY